MTWPLRDRACRTETLESGAGRFASLIRRVALSRQHLDRDEAPVREGARCVRDRLPRDLAVEQKHRAMGRLAAALDDRARARGERDVLLDGALDAHDVESRLRESLPLKIYLWAFFPALGAVLTISTGQQMTHQNGPVGLLVLWGGVAALCVYTWVEFSRLARN